MEENGEVIGFRVCNSWIEVLFQKDHESAAKGEDWNRKIVQHGSKYGIAFFLFIFLCATFASRMNTARNVYLSVNHSAIRKGLGVKFKNDLMGKLSTR